MEFAECVKGLNLKYFTASNFGRFARMVDDLRVELNPRIPVMEIDVTDLFGCFRRYVMDDEGELKSVYKVNPSISAKLDELENICSKLNALGDGTQDDTCAIRGAIALTPYTPNYNCASAKDAQGKPVTRQSPLGGAVIRFPTPKSFYRVTETVLLPFSKAVALVGSAAHGATIRIQDENGKQIPGVQYVFEAETADNGSVLRLTSRSFERLNFVNGGIALQPHLKRWQVIRDCVFVATPSWAIKSINDSAGNSDVVNLEIRRCVFLGCNGGVHAAGEQLVGWSIDQCRFRGNTGVDVYIHQGEVHLVDCDFSGRRPDLLHLPYIQIAKPAQATTITNCRIGSEAKPPRDLIVVGPLPGKLGPPFTYHDNSSGYQDIVIEGCVFGGPNTPYNSESSVLRLRLAMMGLRLRSCTVWSFGKLLWEEAREDTINVAAKMWAEDKSENRTGIFTLANVAGQSLLAHLAILGTVGQVFTQGGRGFEVVGTALERRTGRGAGETRAGVNLLKDTEAANLALSEYWDKPLYLEAVKSADPTSPNGSTAWKLTRKGVQGFSARIAQTLDAETTKAIYDGGSAVFSIWLRREAGDDTTVASLECIVNEDPFKPNADAFFGLARSPIFRLSDNWQRYTLLIERFPLRQVDPDRLDNVEAVAPGAFDAPRLRPRIRLNHGHWADTFGSKFNSVIWAAQPQLERGDTPTPYMPGMALSKPHAPRLEQSLMLGRVVVGYGTEPPQDGPYALGDLIFNTAPTAGDFRGWVCTQPSPDGGSAATWTAFGKIALS